MLTAFTLIVPQDAASQTNQCSTLGPGLLAFGLSLVAVTTHFTAELASHMDVMGGFIRTSIEIRYRPVGWESAWPACRRTLLSDRRQARGFPLGSSKVYAYGYLTLSAGVVAEYFIAGGLYCPARILSSFLPLMISVWLAIDLHLRRGARWHSPFESTGDEELNEALGGVTQR